ncbi:hypothetical protein APX01_05485 [Cereibacter sphaeroides]|nr:hypothetical protein APX01_05485 [Cereibacter sphaeroides]ANS33714.1 hypothetical protein A3858_05510 [Cereibacter sphaeroides]ATN62757.1 hypothetical protein A3857_05505 [Cereibacter sphaeroides]
MALAGACSADEHDVALVGDEAPVASSRTRASLTGVPVKSNCSMSFTSGSLAIVIWQRIERACFSAISDWSRSPTILGGSCWRLMPFAMTSS